MTYNLELRVAALPKVEVSFPYAAVHLVHAGHVLSHVSCLHQRCASVASFTYHGSW